MTTLIAPNGKAALLDHRVEPGGDTPTSFLPNLDIDLDLNLDFDADEEWRDFALCKDDPEPDRWVDLPQVVIKGRLNPEYDERVAELSAICSTCPVMATCLGESLGMNVRGVFAGQDEFDRADIRESLGLPTPPLVPAPETDDDARLIEQQFTAQRLARRGLSNKQIAAALAVSTMTVSRLLASEDRPANRRSRKTAADDDQMLGRVNRTAATAS
jgi:hypothetical protein